MIALRRIADEHGIVLIADEIQTGFGRTGKLFGFQHSGVEPDLVTVAKSLAGGFLLSGVVGKAEVMDSPTPGGLGGTYGGNAIACAAGLAVMAVFEEEGRLEHSVKLGERLRVGLDALQQKYSNIGEVRGRGCMLAIEVVEDRASKKPAVALAQSIIDQARSAGLLLIKCGVQRNVIRFLAPLTTTNAQSDESLSMLDTAFSKCGEVHHQ
jgi:4-aminobutyrate aminotransferase/(S)-3-amino-2-methylpropionate transaminase